MDRPFAKQPTMHMDVAEFDLDKYLRASKRVDLSTVQWDRIGEHPVSSDEARCLTYMMDIETHTVVFLRDLLATRASFDPEVTAFLSCWVYEELWHGEAFSRFLGEAGHRVAPSYEEVAGTDPFPTRLDRNLWIRRKVGTKGYVSHIGTLLGSALFKDFVAVHMTWGAVNELGTLTGYHRIIAKTEHPVLIALLQAVIKDERRHFAFYRAQARMRLARSRQARAITRWALEHLWAPVGTGVRPQAETDFVIHTIFGDADGMVAVKEMENTIGALPGLEGTHFMQDALRGAARRLGKPLGLGVG
ncbi:MAG TPA: ferritin-like domain-containing protein [Actinomycetota bacterium]|jgi:rubrerythrin|nr:ferritin-like domain-containing protein [Actinomycetota bacterium]